jgi:L-lactate utilization protein LutB
MVSVTAADTPRTLRYRKLGPRLVRALERRFFEAWYFDGPAEAAEKILSLIPPADTVSWGGSMTMEALGIQRLLAERGYRVIDRDTAKSPEERKELMRRALLCDTFLCGANALSEDGQIVNIDGNGNRLAALLFGPRQVIVAAGLNKAAKTVEDALVRARTAAAPLNVQRFPGYKTPCAETGSCGNCTEADSVCSHIVTTRLCKPPGRIKVVLVGTDLGL